MRQQAVHDYVKKKRGLYAADGGEVPEDDGYYDSEAKTWVPNQPTDAAQPDHGENLADATPAAKSGNPVDDIQNGAADEDEPDDGDSEPDAAPAEPDRQQTMKDYLAKKYGEASDDSGIKSAIDDAKGTTKMANVLQGLAGMGGAAGVGSGYTPDHSGFDNIRKQAKDNVAQAMGERQQKIQDFVQQNVMNRQAAQDQMTKGTYDNQQKAAKLTQDMNDPKSDYSAAMRAPFVQLWGDQLEGADVEKMSASQMHTLADQLEKKATIEGHSKDVQTRADATTEAAKGRNQAHADNVAAAKARADEIKTTKEEDKIAKEEHKLSEAMDPNRNRAGLKAQEQGRLNNADRAAALIYDDNGKELNLNPEQMGEAAQAWAAMIGNGSVQADAAVTRLLPHTASGKIADVKQWITGEPQGADQQAFLKMMGDSIRREKAVAYSHLRKAQVQAAAGSRTFREKYPDKFNAIVQSAGIDPSEIDEKWQYAPKGVEEEAPKKNPPPMAPMADMEAEMKKRGLKPKSALGAVK